MNEEIEKLRKSIKAYKAILVLVLLLLLVLVAAVGVGGFYLYNMSQELIPATRKLVEVDWTRLYDQVLKVDPFELKAEIENISADVEAIKQAISTFH